MKNKYQSNFYYKLNSKNFLLLVSLKQQYKNYSIIIKNKYQNLYFWINDILPLLKNPIYNLSTKCYWILNNIQDFPKCKQCGKKIGILCEIGRSKKRTFAHVRQRFRKCRYD